MQRGQSRAVSYFSASTSRALINSVRSGAEGDALGTAMEGNTPLLSSSGAVACGFGSGCTVASGLNCGVFEASGVTAGVAAAGVGEATSLPATVCRLVWR